MNEMEIARRHKNALRREARYWQWTAVCLAALFALKNAAMAVKIIDLERRRNEEAAQYQAQIDQAEHIRDLAVRELGAVSIQRAEEQRARDAQAAAYAELDGYRYIGECTITAYCVCEECCGNWADGMTATGLPAGPGIVAVDESVIPLGSTVIIDGQRYLAADTGVTGNHVDVFMNDHAAAVRHGVKTADVWAVLP